MNDWQDLSERLRKLGVKSGVQNNRPQNKLWSIEKIIDCNVTVTPCGPILSTKQKIPLTYTQGISVITPNTSFNRLLIWANIPITDPIRLEDFIFIDTETTGLSGGTGTLPFIVGVAKFAANSFQLEQFFLRNPSEEDALLHALSLFCENLKAVVSYNGKAFDIPILNTRHILQRLLSPFLDVYHIDLLTISRQLWRLRLSECRLANIEQKILGFHREEDDVPGYLVPGIYNEYLRTGNARPLKGVFYHNQQDVISLAALFSLIATILEDPYKQIIPDAVDTFSIAKVFENLDEFEIAHALYQQAQCNERNHTLRTRYLLQQANLYKRQKRIELAIPLWKEASKDGSIIAMEELAKYYEHSLKDYSKALSVTENAINELNNMHNSNSTIIKNFSKRKNRLLHKINNVKIE